MGFSPFLIFFPLGVLLVFAAIGAAGFTLATQNGAGFTLGQTGNSTGYQSFQCSSSTVPCLQGVTTSLPVHSIISCSSTSNALGGGRPNNCYIIAGFSCYVTSPFWCILGGSQAGTYMDTGDTAVVGSSSITKLSNNGAASFNVGAIGPGGWIAIIGAVVAVAVLAGLTVLGSGLQGESIQIIFQAGLLLGMWAVLSAAVVLSPINGFASIDNDLLAGAGTGLYVLLTLIYAAGIGKAVSRGG